jgi:hypothetical protein
MTRECRDCKYASADPDGPYCGHPESFKISMFGGGLGRMRSSMKTETDGKCGPDGELWEEREPTE